ncbi:MAG: metal-dependent hydrolase [Candidatus Cloacimonetes bacterium]|nr:metal-dependent hydrolase [Candidatus Cloacimonadota bacterium]
MKLTYLGHSAFKIVTNNGITILIDPYVDKNPLAPIKAKHLQADYIVLTHAHGDHLGDAFSIANMNNTVFICVSELASYVAKKGYKVHAMQIGGAFTYDFGKLRLTMALHGSMTPDGLYGGLAAGVILEVDGVTIYHCGDTGIFGDMKMIGEMFKINYLLVPIGGNYTMDIDDAVLAVKMITPDIAIPMHYNTFPAIIANPEEFVKKLEAEGLLGMVMQPGEEM